MPYLKALNIFSDLKVTLNTAPDSTWWVTRALTKLSRSQKDQIRETHSKMSFMRKLNVKRIIKISTDHILNSRLIYSAHTFCAN